MKDSISHLLLWLIFISLNVLATTVFSADENLETRRLQPSVEGALIQQPQIVKPQIQPGRFFPGAGGVKLPELVTVPLTVNISPSKTLTVDQGHRTAVTYSANANRQGVTLNWSGAHQQGSGERFSVNTARLAPGQYPITLIARVTQIEQGITSRPQDTARAQVILVVKQRVETVIVPDVINDGLEDAEFKIENRKLVIGNIRRVTVSSGADNRVIGQAPKGGEKVKAGERVDLEVTNLKLPPINVKITEKRVTVVRGQTAEFSAEFSPRQVNLSWKGAGVRGDGKRFRVPTSALEPKEYKITLLISDRSKRRAMDSAVLVVKPKPPALIPVPDVIGMYKEDALADIRASRLTSGNISTRVVASGEDRIVLEQTPSPETEVLPESEVHLVVSELRIPPLTVRIQPDEITVKQGETAQFRAISDRSGAKFIWGGAERKGKGEWFEIDTSTLNPATYIIDVTAKKKPGSRAQRIQSAHDRAKLIVVSPPQPEPDPPPENFSLQLDATNNSYRVGAAAGFLITPSEQVAGAQYSLYFENNIHSDWSSEIRAVHYFQRIGRHSVQARAQIGGKIYSSNIVEIWIWPEWLIVFLGCIGLLGIGSAVVKAATSKTIRPEPSLLTVNSQIDFGIQEVTQVKIPSASQELDVQFDYGLPGEQEIDVLDEAISGEADNNRENNHE